VHPTSARAGLRPCDRKVARGKACAHEMRDEIESARGQRSRVLLITDTSAWSVVTVRFGCDVPGM
jgi:hypothetical protein